MNYHERVFEAALEDDDFQLALGISNQTPPVPADSLDKAIWAAGYAGWVLGHRGPAAYLKLKNL